MPVITNQPSPQVINPYWQKQVVSDRQEQRSEEIPEFVRENPSLLPWYRRTMESAANRGASSVTFRQVQVQRKAEEVPDVFKQDSNLSNWYGRVMESARERGASSVTFSIPKEPSKLEREPHGATYTGGIEKQYEVSDVDYEPAIVGKSPTSAGRTVMIPRKGSLPQGPTLTGWLLNQSEQAKLYERFVVVGPRVGLGLVTTAGFVASVEGVLNPQTPFVPSAQFIGGYLFGSAILGYGFSKLVQPITQPFTEIIRAKGSEYLTGKYEKAVSEGRALNWKGLPEKIVGALTGGSPKEIGPQLVDVPDIGYTAPRTMSEKVLRLPELESPYQLQGLQPLEAESGALSFGTTTRTALLDPDLVTPLENPVTRQIFSPAGLGLVPNTARFSSFDVLPKFVGASAFLGFQAFQVTKPSVKSEPVLTPLTKLSNILDQPSRTDLMMNADVSQISEVVQLQKLQPLLETLQIQKPISMTKMVTPNLSLYRFDFPKDSSMMKQAFKVPHRKKRKRTSGLYLWEFPILDPEKVLRMT